MKRDKKIKQKAKKLKIKDNKEEKKGQKDEKELRRWKLGWKLALIKRMNPRLAALPLQKSSERS